MLNCKWCSKDLKTKQKEFWIGYTYAGSPHDGIPWGDEKPHDFYSCNECYEKEIKAKGINNLDKKVVEIINYVIKDESNRVAHQQLYRQQTCNQCHKWKKALCQCQSHQPDSKHDPWGIGSNCNNCNTELGVELHSNFYAIGKPEDRTSIDPKLTLLGINLCEKCYLQTENQYKDRKICRVFKDMDSRSGLSVGNNWTFYDVNWFYDCRQCNNIFSTNQEKPLDPLTPYLTSCNQHNNFNPVNQGNQSSNLGNNYPIPNPNSKSSNNSSSNVSSSTNTSSPSKFNLKSPLVIGIISVGILAIIGLAIYFFTKNKQNNHE